MASITQSAPPLTSGNIIERLKRPAYEKQTGARNELGQDDFLRLMTEQLKAQDPSSPQDSSQFISQMSQFATVTGIQGLQQSVETLAQSLQSTQALQASGLVGREVMVASDSANLASEGGISGLLKVPPGASQINLSVENNAGEQVFSRSLAVNGDSSVPFQWSGLDDSGEPMPEGSYRIRAESLINGRSEVLETQVRARVESVSLGGQESGLKLNLAGLGQLPASQVTEIR